MISIDIFRILSYYKIGATALTVKCTRYIRASSYVKLQRVLWMAECWQNTDTCPRAR